MGLGDFIMHPDHKPPSSLADMNASPLKVMILTLEYTPRISGGAGTHVYDLAAGLRQAGHEVCVLAYSASPSATIHESGVIIHFVSPGSSEGFYSAHRSMVQDILAFNEDLVSYVQSVIPGHIQKPDIIHYHNWYTYPAARRLADFFGVPAIGTIHFISEPIERWWGQTPDEEIVHQEKELFKQAGPIITVSESLRDLIQATHRVQDYRINVVYNGLNTASFIKSKLKPEAHKKLRQTLAAEGEKVLIYAGRLNPMKGISSLLNSAARVLSEHPNARYLIVGEPDSRDYGRLIEGIFQKHPMLKKHVRLMGKLPREHLALLYQVADIALIPSIYDPFPYAALEAMSAGIPVIASRVGGLAEVNLHAETGLLVSVRPAQSGLRNVDEEELYAAQMTLLGDDSLRATLGEAARQRIIKEFNVEKMIQSIAQLYRQTISASRMYPNALRG